MSQAVRGVRTPSRRSLIFVGVGIRAGVETTPETHAHIRSADKVLYLVGDALAAAWIEQINPTAESLASLYTAAKREDIYAAIIATILAWLRRSRRLCVVSYGHPGVFSTIAHEAMRRARLEEADVRMLPAISAADRLFADLGVDPGAHGCQSYDATSFLICQYRFDPCAVLLLWQIGAIGDSTWPPRADPQCLGLLAEHLVAHYGAGHEAVMYEAACDPVSDPVITRLPLADLPRARTTTGSTLYVPPKGARRPEPAMLERLGKNAIDLFAS
jgi:tetrapyrrole (corrin/porphyrin) methylase-like protein